MGVEGQTRKRSVRGTGWAIAGLLLVLGGPVAYGLLFELPLMRVTGAPAFAMLAAGAAAGIVAAWRDRRGWVRMLCGVDLAALMVGLYLFFGFAALPVTSAAAQLDTAPDFTLLDHTGELVALEGALAQGPVLLVFYRGHW